MTAFYKIVSAVLGNFSPCVDTVKFCRNLTVLISLKACRGGEIKVRNQSAIFGNTAVDICGYTGSENYNVLKLSCLSFEAFLIVAAGLFLGRSRIEVRLASFIAEDGFAFPFRVGANPIFFSVLFGGDEFQRSAALGTFGNILRWFDFLVNGIIKKSLDLGFLLGEEILYGHFPVADGL